MSYFPSVPLYGTIARTGKLFTVTYHGTEHSSGKREGYDDTTFRVCEPDTPIVDFRPVAPADYFKKVANRCAGTYEEKPQPYDPEKDKATGWGQGWLPVPLQTYLEYCAEAGAKVTTYAEYLEPFEVHGTYCVSNAGGYEVQLSKDGDHARLRECYGGSIPAKVTDWLPIEYKEDPDADPEEGEEGPALHPVIDPNGKNIPLSLVMRAER